MTTLTTGWVLMRVPNEALVPYLSQFTVTSIVSWEMLPTSDDGFCVCLVEMN